MPEGPELHLASKLVNSVCCNRLFTGKVMKSEVSTKNPDVDWNEESYCITSTARGKEVMLNLSVANGNKKKTESCKHMNILFRFGMSGKFSFDPVEDMKKHAHLNFFSKDGQMVLSFVDYRRFGRWEVTGDWGKDRGPCVITEYQLFRRNILENLDDKAFKRPICETLLNQKFFNGIGNYLRAEILFRCGIPPFDCAKDVLESLVDSVKVKSESPDILELCNLLPQEVLNLSGSTGFEVDPGEAKDASAFAEWLQCYYNPSMKNMVDHNGRTIWFAGPAGRMVPTGEKSRKRKQKTHLDKSKKAAAEEIKTEAKVTNTKRVKKEVKPEAREEIPPRKMTRKSIREKMSARLGDSSFKDDNDQKPSLKTPTRGKNNQKRGNRDKSRNSRGEVTAKTKTRSSVARMKPTDVGKKTTPAGRRSKWLTKK